MTEEKSEIGRKSRGKGMRFEVKVRHHLEKDGWTVCKWGNIIKDEKIVAAPRKYNPFTKQASSGNGFPDFVCFRKRNVRVFEEGNVIREFKYGWEVVGIESKHSKYLDAAEKAMCETYKEMKTFDHIYVLYQSKNKKGIEIYEML